MRHNTQGTASLMEQMSHELLPFGPLASIVSRQAVLLSYSSSSNKKSLELNTRAIDSMKPVW